MNFYSSNSYDYDFKEILRLLDQTDSLFKPPLSERVELKRYAKKIYKYASFDFASSERSELVGMIAYYNNDNKSKKAYITFLGVLSSYQKRGIAKRLLQMCISECIEIGMEKIGVETWESNKPVIELYKKFGFRINKIVQDRERYSIKLIKRLD